MAHKYLQWRCVEGPSTSTSASAGRAAALVALHGDRALAALLAAHGLHLGIGVSCLRRRTFLDRDSSNSSAHHRRGGRHRGETQLRRARNRSQLLRKHQTRGIREQVRMYRYSY